MGGDVFPYDSSPGPLREIKPLTKISEKPLRDDFRGLRSARRSHPPPLAVPAKALTLPFTALVNFFRILKGLAALVKVKGRPLAAKNIVKTRLFLKILKT